MSARARTAMNALAQRMMRHYDVPICKVMEGPDDLDAAAMCSTATGDVIWSLGTWRPSIVTMQAVGVDRNRQTKQRKRP